MFIDLMTEYGPNHIDIASEVVVSRAALLSDAVIAKRKDKSTTEPTVLRHMWTWLNEIMVLELKTHSRPIRKGELSKLVGYCMLYHALHREEISHIQQMCGAMVVAQVNEVLFDEIKSIGLKLQPESQGYFRLVGPSSIRLYLVVLQEVALAEQDALLTIFATGKVQGTEANRWFLEHARKIMANQPAELLTTDEDFVRELVSHLTPAQRLAGLDPAQRLAGLEPAQRLAGLEPAQRLAGLEPEQVLSQYDAEQRLAGLDADQRLAGLDEAHAVLALPVAALRGLSDQYIATLPADVRRKIKNKLRKG